jgi:hypothetical protein
MLTVDMTSEVPVDDRGNWKENGSLSTSHYKTDCPCLYSLAGGRTTMNEINVVVHFLLITTRCAAAIALAFERCAQEVQHLDE